MNHRGTTKTGRLAGMLCGAVAGLLLMSASSWAITIGAGPAIGTDKKGTTWYQEFQDWAYTDIRALDNNGDGYNFNNDQDTARDIIAFYSHDDGVNVYFRMDFFDLGYDDQNSELDVYVGIDCAAGGQAWFPDWTEFQTDTPWEVCIAVYNSSAHQVYDKNWGTHTSEMLGSYWHSDIDAVEFGISRAFLISQGWDGSSTLRFVPFTTRDSTNGGPGEIPGADCVDYFGTLTRDVGDGNGYLEGSIASDSSTSRAKYAVIAHANQSVATKQGTQAHIFTDYSASLKPGFIRLLDSAEMFNTPINLHVSGTLLMSFLWAKQNPADSGYPDRDGPTFVERMINFVSTGPGSIIGGVLAEHIMPYFEGEVNQKSIEQNNELLEHIFALTPGDMKVMHTPERVIRSNTGNSTVNPAGPLDGKTFEEIENSGFAATYLDEVTHLHHWFYPSETSNPGWDDYNCGRWAGWMGNDEETYHHKVHKINGVYCFMINDREDQAKFGNHDGGMQLDTRYTLLQKALSPDASQLTLVFDDWEAFAGNSFASATPNGNADQFHRTLRWAANHPWIDIVNLHTVTDWAIADSSWVVDHGYVYDKSTQTYEWLKRASEHSYDSWYYGSGLEESFYNRVPEVHNGWSPTGMKNYGDMNSPGTLIRDSWDTIQSITATNMKFLSEWAYSAMIYETAWHDEDANPDQYQSRNYQATFNRNDSCTYSYEDTSYDNTSGWAIRLHGHVRDMGVMKAASDWIENIKSGSQGAATTVYAADIDDDTINEYVLCNNKVFLCFEPWGARLIKAFVYDPYWNGGDAREVIGTPITNPAQESEEEGRNNNRCSVFKEHWSTGQGGIYADKYFAATAGSNYWEFVCEDGLITRRVSLDNGRDVARASYTIDGSVGTLYTRHGFGPNQRDLMFNGAQNLSKRADASYRGLSNSQGGEVYIVAGANTALNNPSTDETGWENRELPLIEQFETYNSGGATQFSMALAFSEGSAWDLDGDGLSNTNEMAIGTNHELWDSDSDGMPDGYEVANNLNPNSNSDKNVDSDLDGASNYAEYVANTRANNSNSVLEVMHVNYLGTRVEIECVSTPDRQFKIYYSDSMTPGKQYIWQDYTDQANGVGTWMETSLSETSYTFEDNFSGNTTGGEPAEGWRVYRIEAIIP